jgi:hypothetical protein
VLEGLGVVVKADVGEKVEVPMAVSVGVLEGLDVAVEAGIGEGVWVSEALGVGVVVSVGTALRVTSSAAKAVVEVL